jgi:peptide/nickel transport system permease protein
VLPFIVRRLVWAVVLVMAITMVSYAMFFLVPTAPGAEVRGQARETTNLRESIRVQGPVYKEYGIFLWRIGHGQFGESWTNDRGVNEVLLQAAPVTLSLVFGGAIVWMLIAIPIGILSALRPRSLLDRFVTIPVLIGVAAHPVWLGLILLYFLGHKAQLFPLGGYCDLTGPDYVCNGFLQWTWHLMLPWLTFALLYAAFYARMIRASIVETMNEDYVRTARAKGASGWRVLRTHVMRNAMLPVVTMIGMDLGLWMGNAIFIESVFGMPGIGRLLTTSLARRDLPVMMAIILFVSLLIVVLNLIVDLIYPAIDPRVRAGRGGWRLGRARAPRSGPVPVSSAEPAQT